MTEPPSQATTPMPDAAKLAEAIERLSRASVLVVGDAMLDLYVHGTVERISPEAPIPVLAVEREVAMPGGAGNVVRNLTALGAAVAFVSVVGDDQAGSDLTGLIGGQPNVEPWLLVQGGLTTTRKTRYLSGGQHLLRADREDGRAIHPKLADRMLRIARDALAATTVTVLSDYGKGVLAGGVAAEIIAAARQAGRKVVVDPKGTDYARYAGADVILCARRDLAEAGGQDVTGDAGVDAAAGRLRAEHGIGAVVVMQAEGGLSLIDAAGSRHFPAEAGEALDLSGAADTAAAALAAALASGTELAEAARLASLAVGLVVTRAGHAVARPAELIEALSPDSRALRKVVPRDTATEQVRRWRDKGWRIGFASGELDPDREAHRALLEGGRARCDRLVVAATADLAGAARLARLAAVDLVVTSGTEPPQALLRDLQPDLVVPPPGS